MQEYAKNIWEGLPPTYEYISLLGMGSYGSVVLALNKNNQQKVAIKIFNNIFADPYKWKRIMREVEIITKTNNENIISLKEIILNENYDDLYMVMDYMESDLRKVTKSTTFLGSEHVKLIMYNLFCGIEYLHSCQIIHRDLKPGNILINEDLSIKICDFSISRSLCGLRALEFDFGNWMRRQSYNFSSSNSDATIMDGNSKIYMDGSSFLTLSRIQSAMLDEEDPQSNNILNKHGDMSFMHRQNILNNIQKSTFSRVNIEEEKVEEEDLDEGLAIINHIALQDKHSNIFNMNKSDRMRMNNIETMTTEKASPNIDPKSIPNIIYNFKERRKREEERRNIKREQRNVMEKNLTNNELVRELSNHIVSRWYRPIEIILIETVYTTSIDIWATGCIFAEVLNLMEENQADPYLRRALFPGGSCYPLTPDKKAGDRLPNLLAAQTDQLNLIFELLGSPNTEDLSYITDKNAQEYIATFPKYIKQDLRALFPGAEPEAINLLEETLKLNPYKRITAKEALRHKYFKSIRDKKLEKGGKPVFLLVDTVQGNIGNLREITNSLLAELLKLV